MTSATTTTAPLTEGQADEKRFHRALKISAVLHLTCFGLMLWNPKGLFTGSSKDALRLVPAVRVDVVALPNVLLKDLDKLDLNQEMAKNSDAVPKMKEDAEDEGVSKKGAEEEAFQLKQNAEKKRRKIIEKLRADLLRRMAVERIRRQSAPSGLMVKGNKLSQGTALTGEQLEGASVYGGQIYTLMKSKWNLPPWLQTKNLQAKVVVWIGRKGELLKSEFTKSSGNADFDKYVMRTIDLSTPFPPPPAEYAEYFSDMGLEVGFPE